MDERTDLAKDFCQCQKQNNRYVLYSHGYQTQTSTTFALKAPRRYSGDSGGGFSTAFSFLFLFSLK